MDGLRRGSELNIQVMTPADVQPRSIGGMKISKCEVGLAVVTAGLYLVGKYAYKKLDDYVCKQAFQKAVSAQLAPDSKHVSVAAEGVGVAASDPADALNTAKTLRSARTVVPENVMTQRRIATFAQIGETLKSHAAQEGIFRISPDAARFNVVLESIGKTGQLPSTSFDITGKITEDANVLALVYKTMLADEQAPLLQKNMVDEIFTAYTAGAKEPVDKVRLLATLNKADKATLARLKQFVEVAMSPANEKNVGTSRMSLQGLGIVFIPKLFNQPQPTDFVEAGKANTRDAALFAALVELIPEARSGGVDNIGQAEGEGWTSAKNSPTSLTTSDTTASRRGSLSDDSEDNREVAYHATPGTDNKHSTLTKADFSVPPGSEVQSSATTIHTVSARDTAAE